MPFSGLAFSLKAAFTCSPRERITAITIGLPTGYSGSDLVSVPPFVVPPFSVPSFPSPSVTVPSVSTAFRVFAVPPFSSVVGPFSAGLFSLVVGGVVSDL